MTNITPVPLTSNHTGVNLTQPAESISAQSGKRPQRVKARHLTPLARRIILDRYMSLGDFDEVAEAMEIEGVTGKTVANVVMLSLLPARKPVARQAVITADRRRAS